MASGACGGAFEVITKTSSTFAIRWSGGDRVSAARQVLAGARGSASRARLKRPRRAVADSRASRGTAGIVASTGGPQRLSALGLCRRLLSHCSSFSTSHRVSRTALPVARRQHPFDVRLAVAESARAGGLIAPEGAICRRATVALAGREQPAGLHRPSGDVLLAVSRVCRRRTAAVVLSGMGKDGAGGPRFARRAGSRSPRTKSRRRSMACRRRRPNMGPLILPLGEIARRS